MKTRIAVDAMGGDHAPGAIVEGAVAAARDLDVHVTLVGVPPAVEHALTSHDGWHGLPIDIVDAADVIGMTESPLAALRRKPLASINVAAARVARGDAAALVSAGHTGATVMAAYTAFGMIPGVDRPALATTIPTQGRSAVLLDAGASVECRPQHLLQFAVMGRVYARVGLGVEDPRIGLLSIGEEETKGNELVREAHRLLKASSLPFIGNIEAREIYSGVADVIVCDGFTGNIVLKTSEGLVEMIEALLGDGLQGTLKRLDYAEYGGAPLLGVAGLAIVGHGRSTPTAVRNAIAMAHRFATGGLIHRMELDLATTGSLGSSVAE